MNDDTPPPTDAPTTPAPATRQICCLVTPRRRAPALADQLRAAAVWAQIFQRAEATQAQEEPDKDS